jgi:hypothetical protein
VSVGGSAAFAAHVVAIDSANGNVMTDTLSDNEGNYDLRVFPGSYYVLVLPLASEGGINGPTTIVNYRGFSCAYATTFSTCAGLPANPTDYTGKYY